MTEIERNEYRGIETSSGERHLTPTVNSFTGSAFQWHRAIFVRHEAYRFAHACLWVTPLAVHSRPGLHPYRVRSDKTREISWFKENCWVERYSRKIPFNASSWRLSLVAQRRDDNKVSASPAPSRKIHGRRKANDPNSSNYGTESRNVISVSRYCTISADNFAFTIAFAV